MKANMDTKATALKKYATKATNIQMSILE